MWCMFKPVRIQLQSTTMGWLLSPLLLTSVTNCLYLLINHCKFCCFHPFPTHLFTSESVVDLGFQYNHFPFLPISGHYMPISYFHYLQTLLYQFCLSHICPCHNHKHQSSQHLHEHCFLKKFLCMGLGYQPNAQKNTTWSTRMSLPGTPLLSVQPGRPY